MLVIEAASVAENKFHTVMAEKGEDFGFSLPKAMLVGITVTPTGGVAITPEVAASGDIYQLIDTDEAREAVKRFDFVGLATCGWAAPIDPETGDTEGGDSPAQSTQRRRVRLFIVASRDAVANVLRFQDDAENPILDGEGNASGPLADAIRSLFA